MVPCAVLRRGALPVAGGRPARGREHEREQPMPDRNPLHWLRGGLAVAMVLLAGCSVMPTEKRHTSVEIARYQSADFVASIASTEGARAARDGRDRGYLRVQADAKLTDCRNRDAGHLVGLRDTSQSMPNVSAPLSINSSMPI